MAPVPTVADALAALTTAVANHARAIQGAKDAAATAMATPTPAPPPADQPARPEGH